MRQKQTEKTKSMTEEISEQNDISVISWEDHLGKEVQLFWESIDDE
ncbi:MAG: hypothetical protein QCI00_08375 [Candidatus Thermoplasmatota archaeon]|nr:hypothetical protein [Candidatus Thermoplasmatota archaeon]